MICPDCGSEYREGYTRCAERNVDLIHGESVDFSETDSTNKLSRVLETQSHDLLIEVSFAFEAGKIPYLAQSGTAFDAKGVVERNEDLVWRGALWIPESYQDDAEKIIDVIKTRLAHKSDQNTVPTE